MLSPAQSDLFNHEILSETRPAISSVSFPHLSVDVKESSPDYINRVLLVDDEPSLLEISSLFLEKKGNISVVSSECAEDALDILSSESFDAIVSDYDMPGMNGIEFLSVLRKMGNNIPFILFTGRGREEVVIEALNRGASYYIRKGGTPTVQFTELAHIIQQAALKRRYEDRIRESEKLIYSIFHHLPDAAYAFDTNGRVLAWNHEMEGLTGIAADNAIGKKNPARLIPFYASSDVVVGDILIQPGISYPDCWTILKEREGMVVAEVTCERQTMPVTFRVTSTHVYDPDGKIIGAIESVRDVTLEKKMHQDLEEVNLYHRILIESHIDPLVTLSPDLTICDVNAATENLFGYSRVDLLGTDIARWFLEPEKIRNVCNDMMFGAGYVTGHPFTITCKDGEQEIFLYATSYRDPEGRVMKIFAEFHESVPSVLNS
jgi:PAS domain S-box-containing protein